LTYMPLKEASICLGDLQKIRFPAPFLRTAVKFDCSAGPILITEQSNAVLKRYDCNFFIVTRYSIQMVKTAISIKTRSSAIQFLALKYSNLYIG
jgi:hypothetical protein